MQVSPEIENDDASGPDDTGPGGVRIRNTAILVGLVAVLLGGFALLAAGNDPAAQDWSGRILPVAEEKPDIRLQDTEGQPFDLREDTDGKLTLLMFGYANCPDVCPISLGTLEAALAELDTPVANSIEMVFVTADPARDTPEALREYLDGYDEGFIGLHGTTEEIDEAQRLANVPPAVRETPDAQGNYTVGHASQIIAYQSDGLARIVYPFGTRQQDWLRDLPRLVAGESPAG